MRTSRLSLAAITALGITTATLSANDLIDITLPDAQWKFIGVNGAFGEGSTSADSLNSAYSTVVEDTDGNAGAGGTADGDTNDNLFAELTNGSGTVIKFKVVNNNKASEPTEATLAVPTTGHDYDATSPFRTMYVSADGTGNSDIHILYQAHYEGEAFELKVHYGGDYTIYNGTFQSSATESNPLITTKKTGLDGTFKYDIASIVDMDLSNNPGQQGVAGDKEDYTESQYRDGMESSVTYTDEYIKFFNFDSSNKKWLSYNSKNTNNDFTSVTPGSAYWVKLEQDSDRNTNGHQPGIILGSDGISGDTYYGDNSLVADGWNMLSFDNGNVRESATGLILTPTAVINDSTTATATATKYGHLAFTIYDAFGEQELDINTSVELISVNGYEHTLLNDHIRTINRQIASAERNGSISENFNIRAYADQNNSKVVLLSDKRFRIRDNGTLSPAAGSTISAVTTLGGQNPYVVTNDGATTEVGTYATVTDLTGAVAGAGTADIIASRYGEFALAVKLNESSGVLAGPLENANGEVGAVQINSNTEISVDEASIEAYSAVGDGSEIDDLNASATHLVTDSDIDNAVAIDTDFDGKNDTLILVDNDERFYVRDHTFSRVYEVSAASDIDDTDDLIVDISGAQTVVDLAASDPVANVATAINTASAGSIKSAVISGQNIAVVSDSLADKSFDLKDADADDILTSTSSTDALAQGAIKDVYTVANLSKATIQEGVLTVTVSDLSGADNNISLITPDNVERRFMIVNAHDDVTGGMTLDRDYNITSGASGSYDDDFTTATGITLNNTANDGNLTSYHNTVDAAASAFADYNISLNGNILGGASNTAKAYAYMINFFSKLDNLNIRAEADSTTLTISGDFNLSSTGTTAIDAGTDLSGSAITQNGKMSSIPSLTSDLKYNAVWSPDFPIEEGPVFRLKNEGFKTVKMLSAMEDTSGGISWSYLDLTKDSDEWFNLIDDYTLFNVDRERGYWVYLEADTDNPISIDGGNAVLTTNYIHHYNSDTDNSESSKNLTVDNYISNGTLSVPITGISGDNYNVFATINGINIPMVKSGNNFYLDFSSYELGNLPASKTSVIISAFDEFGNMQKDTDSVVLDNEPPVAPTVSFVDGKNIQITSSDDVAAYYLYSGRILDRDPVPSTGYSTTFIGKVLAADASSYNVCSLATSSGSTSAFESLISGWKLFAVDGDGNPDNSRVSDISFINSDRTASGSFYPIYTNASILSSSGDKDVNPQTYDATCNKVADLSSDNGVSLEAMNSNTVSVAYETKTTTSLEGAGVPEIAYVSVGGTIIAKLEADSNMYTADTTKSILIYHNGSIYRKTFNELFTSHDTEATALNLTSGDIVGISGQTITKE